MLTAVPFLKIQWLAKIHFRLWIVSSLLSSIVSQTELVQNQKASCSLKPHFSSFWPWRTHTPLQNPLVPRIRVLTVSVQPLIWLHLLQALFPRGVLNFVLQYSRRRLFPLLLQRRCLLCCCCQRRHPNHYQMLAHQTSPIPHAAMPYSSIIHCIGSVLHISNTEGKAFVGDHNLDPALIPKSNNFCNHGNFFHIGRSETKIKEAAKFLALIWPWRQQGERNHSNQLVFPADLHLPRAWLRHCLLHSQQNMESRVLPFLKLGTMTRKLLFIPGWPNSRLASMTLVVVVPTAFLVNVTTRICNTWASSSLHLSFLTTESLSSRPRWQPYTAQSPFADTCHPSDHQVGWTHPWIRSPPK